MMRIDLVGWPLLMIALAMGYLVCVKANKVDNKALKMVGCVIGIIILAVSLILAVSDLGMRLKLKKGAMAGPPRRPAGMTTRPAASPNVNIPMLPRAPRSAIETAPAAQNIPNPPAIPKGQ